MAHWGSIVSGGEKTDAQRAVQTALDMRHALAKLNEGWKLRGVMELKFGIGINHGPAIVGNLGCEEKMEVSVIGDAINLASRLEGVTKEYGIDLALGELAEPLVRDAFIVRSVDLLVVKGKTKPVGVFTVLDRRDTGAEPPWLALHEEAVVLYRAGDFSNAEKKWREVLAQSPQDSIAKVFAVRCAELQRNPPDADWDGVFVMTKK
jgi:adenylate cyclase